MNDNLSTETQIGGMSRPKAKRQNQRRNQGGSSEIVSRSPLVEIRRALAEEIAMWQRSHRETDGQIRNLAAKHTIMCLLQAKRLLSRVGFARAPCSAENVAVKAAVTKARKEAFTQAAEYVRWAKTHFLGLTEIEQR